MDEDPRLAQAFDLIRKVVAEAYRLGADKGREQVIQAAVHLADSAADLVRASPANASPKTRPALQEHARRLIDRTLAKYAPQGVNVAGIYGCREGAEEAVALPDIRAELHKGLIEGRYRLEKDCWFLNPPGN